MKSTTVMPLAVAAGARAPAPAMKASAARAPAPAMKAALTQEFIADKAVKTSGTAAYQGNVVPTGDPAVKPAPKPLTEDFLYGERSGMRTVESRSSAAMDIQSVVVPSEAAATRPKSKFSPLFQDFLYGDRSGMGSAAARRNAAADIQSVQNAAVAGGAVAPALAPAGIS